jgi:Clp amino terminal domain, pathogenicity island component
MHFNRKTTALVLVGAMGVSSVAYGVGTQVGGGSSEAAGNRATAQRGFDPPGFDDLAQQLGVDADALRDALRDFHEQEHSDMRDAFAAALAKALGKSTDDVQAALDSLESARTQRFADRLAQALDADADAVAKALDELKDERPQRPGDFAADLAKKLGLDAADVRAALMELRPDELDGRHRRPEAMSLRGLATELDVTRGELRRALREMRAGADLGPRDRRDDLVKFLAERFNLSEDKVDAGLPQFLDRGPGGPCGPGGPGRTFGPGGPPHP